MLGLYVFVTDCLCQRSKANLHHDMLVLYVLVTDCLCQNKGKHICIMLFRPILSLLLPADEFCGKV